MGRRKKKEKMIIGMAFLISVCLGAMLFCINKNEMTDSYFYYSVDQLGDVVLLFQAPGLYLVTEQDDNSFMEILENRILARYPLYICSVKQAGEKVYGESKLLNQMVIGEEEPPTAEEEGNRESEEGQGIDGVKDNTDENQEDNESDENRGNDDNSGNENNNDQNGGATLWKGNLSADEEAMYPLSSIKDYELALDTFYQVDSTTEFDQNLLNVEEFLKKDMTIDTTGEEPKILIYHTHSHEGYKDSDKTVVDVGNILTDLLENTYGIKVLHHVEEYDAESRDYAYSNALPDLIRILEEHPSIQVVIDLHRDGVREDVHLVTTIDGKPVAKLMFFNGISRTRKNGPISYLENPNLEDNLAFSFQMQLAARTYFPTLTRDIYIKGYRYNLHLMPKSLLVEVGAQTNTFEEAANAMTYLAELLYRVLTIKR